MPRGPEDGVAGYGFEDGPRWRFTVPGRERAPRMAFLHGIGQGADSPAEAAPWTRLFDRHRRAPFHLLLCGGTQVDGGDPWETCPSLARWRRRPAAERAAAAIDPDMVGEATAHVMDRYLAAWRRAEVAQVLATIPAVMMWDAGDMPGDRPALAGGDRDTRVGRAVRMVARRHAALFQLGAAPEALPESVWGADRGAWTVGLRTGDLGLLALDTMGERTPARLFGEATWTALPGWLDRFGGCGHLLVMADPPPLPADDAGPVARLVGGLEARAGLPRPTRAQAADWRRLLDRLSEFSFRAACRVTILSGLSAGAMRSVRRAGGTEIWHLVAASMAHRPAGRMAGAFLEWRLAAPRSLDDGGDGGGGGGTLEFPPFAESGHRLLRARGWLALEIDRKGHLNARWDAEPGAGAGPDASYRLTI